jgi:hypothetical protein
LGDPWITLVQVGSPTLPNLKPSANTVRDPPLKDAVWGTHINPNGVRCVVFECPAQLNGKPLANTVLTCPALRGTEQSMASLSPSLATAGMPIFMDSDYVLL